MNWSVRADLPTPPLPTIITLWRAREFCPFGFAAAMALCTERCKYQREKVQDGGKGLWNVRTAKIRSKDCRSNKGLNDSSCGEFKKEKKKKEKDVASYFPVPPGSISAFWLHSHHGNKSQTNKRLKKQKLQLDLRRRTKEWFSVA